MGDAGQVRVLWGGLLAVALVAGGCTSGPPDPAPAVDQLARALSEGDVTGVSFDSVSASQVQQDLAAATDGMSPARAEVVVLGTVPDETDEAPTTTATLSWTWDLDGAGPGTQTWAYDSEVALVTADVEGETEWQVRWSRAVVHPDLGEGAALSLTRTQPQRADILGAGEAALVTARPVQRVGVDKLRLDGADPEPSARALADLVGIDADSYVERVAAAGPEAFVDAIVLREGAAAAISASVEGIDGARMIADELPLAPSREFARALLGTVGPATAEIVDATDGAVAGTDLVGQSGLQARYDEQLRGEPGYTVEAVVDADASTEQLAAVAATPGTALVTTLDRDVQQLADTLLADVDSPSALVALRPSTGDLLAVASGPGSDGYSTATLGQYPPGSVFKIVTALSLLRTGLTPDSALPCTETTTVEGRTFTNYSGYPANALGDIALERAFAESCNTAFVRQVDTLTWQDVGDAAAALGLDVAGDLGFDAFLADVGEPDGAVEEAAGMIGQGTVLMSPLGAVTMAASAVAGPVTPVLVPTQAATAPAASVTPDETEQLGRMMRTAVTDGTADVLSDVPGDPVAAKTGTAEFGTATPLATHGWMVAVQGDLAAAVFVEEAESGSGTAGPILREFLSRTAPASP